MFFYKRAINVFTDYCIGVSCGKQATAISCCVDIDGEIVQVKLSDPIPTTSFESEDEMKLYSILFSLKELYKWNRICEGNFGQDRFLNLFIPYADFDLNKYPKESPLGCDIMNDIVHLVNSENIHIGFWYTGLYEMTDEDSKNKFDVSLEDFKNSFFSNNQYLQEEDLYMIDDVFREILNNESITYYSIKSAFGSSIITNKLVYPMHWLLKQEELDKFDILCTP